MRLIGNIFKAVVGVVTSIAAVISSGCMKHEEVKCYYGPAPAQTAEPEQPNPGEPELVPSSRDIEEEPLDVYGPPPFEEEPVDIAPEMNEEPTAIYGPPESFGLDPDVPEPELMDASVVAYYGPPPDDPDASGKSAAISAQLMMITPEDDHFILRVNAGKNKGVQVGAAGELYIGSEIVKNGDFTVTKVQSNACFAQTNVPMEQLSKVTKVIIRNPDNRIKPQPLPKDEGKVIALYGVSPVPPSKM